MRQNVAIALALACGVVLASQVTRAQVPSPAVLPPAETGEILMGEPERVAAYGYSETELFFEGTASSFRPIGELGNDGRFAVEPAEKAPYRMRMVVRAPKDAAHFNGIVLVEWFNVSGQVEAGPDFGFLYKELFRDGYAYVGVGAQIVGLTGAQGLKVTDPERYGSLHHPGDSFSYDIYSQAAQAIRKPSGLAPLGELTSRIRFLIAAGESQSAGRMVTYVDAIHPLAKVYDGFFIHSRGASGAPLSQAASGDATQTVRLPSVAPIRTDLEVPVFQFQAETDVPRFVPARQPDSDRVRTWEMAGTAHYDRYGLTGGGEREMTLGCGGDDVAMNVPVNDGPQTFLLRSGLRSLHRWMEGGEPPAMAEPFRLDGTSVARDPATGNALGGVRTPQLDVPVRTLHGVRGPAGGGRFCFLFGRTDEWNGDSDPYDGGAADPSPTPEPVLEKLYPTRADYLGKFHDALERGIEAGFLLREDAEEIPAEAMRLSKAW